MATYENQLQQRLTDPDRLAELHRTQLLDSPPEAAFDRLTQMALRLTGAPLSLVSLVTDDRQYFKSTAGLPEELGDLRTTPLSHSFCQHVVACGDVLSVEDTRTDPIVHEVQSIQDFGIHTYLGIPIKTSSSRTLGTLCVLGYEPRQWTEMEIETMRDLASIGITEVALRLELILQAELQAAIKERETRYRSVIEGIHDVVFKLDGQGLIRFVNPAWESVMGYGLEKTLGRPIGDFLPQDEIYGDPLSALHAHAAKHKTYKTHFLSHDGTMQWLEIRANHQSENGLAGIITDVTNNYRFEAEREAREQAERHLRLKDALLSNMTHEIRTPLSAIMSCSEILHAELAPEQQEYTEMIRQGGERLLTTLDLILLYAQAQSNNFKLNHALFNLTQVARDIIDPISAVNVTIDLISPEEVQLESDVEAIETVLKCLIDNAVKFTREGRVDILIERKDMAVHICVTDTGIGIPHDYLPRLYIPFSQASNGNTRDFEGSGLGLPLTKLLVEKLGGALHVVSQENVGSTFTVTLPAIRWDTREPLHPSNE